jgi:hypothetical protein
LLIMPWVAQKNSTLLQRFFSKRKLIAPPPPPPPAWGYEKPEVDPILSQFGPFFHVHFGPHAAHAAHELVLAAEMHPAAAGALWAVSRSDPLAVLGAAAVPVLLRIARGACDDAACEATLALCALAACPEARRANGTELRSVAQLTLMALRADEGGESNRAPNGAPRVAVTLATIRAALARLKRPPKRRFRRGPGGTFRGRECDSRGIAAGGSISGPNRKFWDSVKLTNPWRRSRSSSSTPPPKTT